jgi:hypothetical protein
VRYILDFGSVNAGQVPAFTLFADSDTLAAIPAQPTIVEQGQGIFYFDLTWPYGGANSITFKCVCNGIELSDVISETAIAATVNAPLVASAAPWYGTAGDIVNDAAVEAGIDPDPDPYASTNPNFVQLCRLLKTLGRDLVHRLDWTHLQKEFTFTTVQGQSIYPLPSDFHHLLEQSGWNRTTRFPLGGPASPQEWQYLSSRLVGIVFRTIFRRQQGQFYIYPPASVGSVPGNQDIAFDYLSSWWVQPLGQQQPTQDAPSLSNDTLYFDPLLLVRGLKAAFLAAKDLPGVATARAEFEETLSWIAGDDANARLLNMTGGVGFDPLISNANLPITGYGQP